MKRRAFLASLAAWFTPALPAAATVTVVNRTGVPYRVVGGLDLTGSKPILTFIFGDGLKAEHLLRGVTLAVTQHTNHPLARSCPQA